jgi:hypothetical protein
MDIWRVVLWGLGAVGAVAAVYGLHRLCLWLEERGWLYYLHKKSGGSTAGCLTALQQALEPQTRHVLHVKEERRGRAEEDAPGEGDASGGVDPRRP